VVNVRALLKRLTTDYTDDTDEEYGSPAICLFIGVIRVIRGKNPRKASAENPGERMKDEDGRMRDVAPG
jgi:hypothetical protein